MPKIVDHDARRVDLARAAAAVARRDGIDEVTVRNVASQAGVSAGALRHYFPRQADLLRENVDGRVGEDPEPGWRPVPGW